MDIIKGGVRLLGEAVSTDLHCTNKYLPGKRVEEIAAVAFEALSPGFAQAFAKGDVIVAGRNFGINSSREQALQVMHRLGVAAVVAPSFGRLFYRNAINNGLPVIECPIDGIEQEDAIEIDLERGRVSVPARHIVRSVPPLPAAVQGLLAAGGLIPFLRRHPDWKLAT